MAADKLQINTALCIDNIICVIQTVHVLDVQ